MLILQNDKSPSLSLMFVSFYSCPLSILSCELAAYKQFLQSNFFMYTINLITYNKWIHIRRCDNHAVIRMAQLESISVHKQWLSACQIFYLTYLIGIRINYRLSINCSTYNINNFGVINNLQLVTVLIGRLMGWVMSVASWRFRYKSYVHKNSLKSLSFLDSRPDYIELPHSFTSSLDTIH